MIHLDTNVAIVLLNGSLKNVRSHFDAALEAGTSIAMSTIVHHELMYGAAYSQKRSANEDKITLFLSSADIVILAFTQADSREAADLRAHLKREGTPIGPYDTLIAAQARRAGATLTTANTREFERVPGLMLIDWAA